MPIELLVILGAEATILVFVVAMTLYAKRMDVLSGRSLEHPVVSPRSNRHRPRSIRQKARYFLRLSRRWGESITIAPPGLLRRADVAKMQWWIQQTRPHTPSWLVTRFRQRGTSATDTSTSRSATLSEPGRKAGAH